ncbi:predicted protein [Uncinocarpus reesii 1704]|uniref:Uncharacterized protein n=1 Tax=Uncinocarpus reesii (strain UAMH 1704) TaxID=336963 RepID=C4JWK5_UNCRE|nr:uncharacterized protein UREG_06947 [Uncinocarpus reesii 1704]EEP82082.1 predicted protein [Uncinocarpus reesii 1704]
MASRHSSTPESGDEIKRKRVGKACDRCRMKKSKVELNKPAPSIVPVLLMLPVSSPVSATGAILANGAGPTIRFEKVYPKGFPGFASYMEMLEEQQNQLVAGLRLLYRRVQEGEGWPGKPVQECNGRPLTHEILEALGVLNEMEEPFEESVSALRNRYMTDRPDLTNRRESGSSIGDYSSFTSVQSTDLSQQSQAALAQRQELLTASMNAPRPSLWEYQLPTRFEMGRPGLVHGNDPLLSGDNLDYFQPTAPLPFSQSTLTSLAVADWQQMEFD